MKVLNFSNFNKISESSNLDKSDEWIRDMVDYLEDNYPQSRITTKGFSSGHSFSCLIDFNNLSIEERELMKKDIIRGIENIEEKTIWGFGNEFYTYIEKNKKSEYKWKKSDFGTKRAIEFLEHLFKADTIESVRFFLHQKVAWMPDSWTNKSISESTKLKDGEEWIMDIVDNIELEYPDVKISYTPIQNTRKSQIYLKMDHCDKEDKRKIINEIFSNFSIIEENSGMRIVSVMGSDLKKRDSKHIPPSYSNIDSPNYEESLEYLSESTILLIEFMPKNSEWTTTIIPNKP
jgi:hypothetical protein